MCTAFYETCQLTSYLSSSLMTKMVRQIVLGHMAKEGESCVHSQSHFSPKPNDHALSSVEIANLTHFLLKKSPRMKQKIFSCLLSSPSHYSFFPSFSYLEEEYTKIIFEFITDVKKFKTL